MGGGSGHMGCTSASGVGPVGGVGGAVSDARGERNSGFSSRTAIKIDELHLVFSPPLHAGGGKSLKIKILTASTPPTCHFLMVFLPFYPL